jgi:hypothetical protein
MRTNAALLPLIDQDQYVLFCLDEINHHSTPLVSGMTLVPGVLAGCEFFTVRWIDQGSRQVFYLIFHMSGNYALIIDVLRVVRLVADPVSITVTTAHNPPDSDERPLVVATALGIPLIRVQHVQNGHPLVQLGMLT